MMHTQPETAERHAPAPAPGARFPFTLEQEFLRLQHEHDGSTAGFGQRPISSGGWRLRGPLDAAVLRRALDDVVARHEPLHTAVVRGQDGWQQEVRPPRPARLEIRDLAGAVERDAAAERFLDEIEARPFGDLEPPLLWAYLGRFDDTDAVLVLVGYLPLIDVWSIGIIAQDLAACYEARAAGREPPPRTAVPSYRDYAATQRSGAGAAPEDALDFWRARLDGARAIALTSDHPPAAEPSGTTRVDRFVIDRALGAAALELGRGSGCSPFMVLLAVHLLQLQRLTGAADGVVWTLTSGPARRQERYERTVGYFVNMSPLRTDIGGCATFRDVLLRVRAGCFASYPNEVPFVRLAQHLGAAIGELEQGGMIVPGFAVFQNPGESRERTAAGVTFAAVRRRLSQEAGPGIPDDAILYTIDIEPTGELFYAMSSSTDRYEHPSTLALAAGFQELFAAAVRAPDAPLHELRPGGTP